MARSLIPGNISGRRTCYKARIFLSASVSIPSAAWTILAFDSENYDVGMMHDPLANTRITIPTSGAGPYLVIAAITFASNATGNRGVRIQKNGAGEVVRDLEAAPSAGSVTTVDASDVLLLNPGDYIEIAAWQNSGSALNALGGTDRTYCTVIALA